MMNKNTPITFRRLALAVSLAVASQAAYSLGLGKMEVLSALDEPLDARVPFTSLTAAEKSKLETKLASRQDFQAAGIDYPAFLSDLNFKVVPSKTGGSELRITTNKVLREPVVHLLLQLDWPEGRLIREYTALLDPPLYGESNAIQPRPAVASSSRKAVRTAAAPVSRPAPSSSYSSAKSVDPGTRYGPVREGETLWAIAEKNYGVSDAHLFQIMASILRKNPGAFVDGNMHGLMAGMMLNMPTETEYGDLPIRSSYNEFVAQTETWKQILARLQNEAPKLAGAEIGSSTATAGSPEPAKTASGDSGSDELQILVADNKSASGDAAPAGSTAPGDAKTEKQLRNRVALLEESLEAKESETKELSERVRLLEQQLEKARKLIELQNADLARIQKRLLSANQPDLAADTEQLQTTDTAQTESESEAQEGAPMVAGGIREQLSAEADKVIPQVDLGGEDTPPAMADAQVEPAGDVPENTVMPAEDTRPAMVTQADTPSESDDMAGMVQPKPEAVTKNEASGTATPTERPRPRIKIMDEPAEGENGGFLAYAKETVMDAMGSGSNKFLLPILGVLALGLGFFIVRRRRSIAEFEESILSTNTFETQSDINVSEISAVPQAEETFLNEFGNGDQTQIEEVDPISEAEVYLAYGRDEQAERVLLDGVRKDPDRLELKTKLLEVYKQRGKVREFETLAEEIYATHGQDANAWGPILAMGQQVSPENPLFKEAKAKVEEPKPEVVAEAPKAELPAETIEQAPVAKAESKPVETEQDYGVVDFDDDVPGMTGSDSAEEKPDLAPKVGAFQMSPPSEAKDQPETSKVEQEEVAGVTLDVPQDSGLKNPGSLDFESDSLDFEAPELPKEKLADVSDGDLAFGEAAKEPEPADDKSGLKEEGVNSMRDMLDFGSDDIPVFRQDGASDDDDDEMEVVSSSASKDSLHGDLDWDENTTKLDLAKAYIDMGDAEGARSILAEVLKDGSAIQKQQAADLMTQAAAGA